MNIDFNKFLNNTAAQRAIATSGWGACCIYPQDTGGFPYCATTTEANCNYYEGTYQGDGIDCSGVTCLEPPQHGGHCCVQYHNSDPPRCLDVPKEQCKYLNSNLGNAKYARWIEGSPCPAGTPYCPNITTSRPPLTLPRAENMDI